jgi:hypothetical protein
MKVIWTLKNKPSPHIHDKATEFPHSSAFNQRKFMKTAKEAPFRRWSKLDSRGLPAARLHDGEFMASSGTNHFFPPPSAKEDKGRWIFHSLQNLALLATWRFNLLNHQEIFTAKTPRKTREDGFSIFFKTWRSWRLGGSTF